MGIRTGSGGTTRAFAWLVALIVLIFMSSACGQTSSEENADDTPPANAPEENAPAEDQGGDQAEDQGDDQADDQSNDQSDNQDDQADDQGDDDN